MNDYFNTMNTIGKLERELMTNGNTLAVLKKKMELIIEYKNDKLLFCCAYCNYLIEELREKYERKRKV